ncbi:MAG: NAD(P)H-hydrate dehydratase [Planctomycetota bacterium]|nr:MAG: NAD(P)H-hydrate dehydratase [Planctomycetota bacterium]
MRVANLRTLIREGDFEGVQRAIDEFPELVFAHDPNPENWEERTALHCAARWAQLDVCKLLVERGAEVYSNPFTTYPPVFVADRYRVYPDRPNAQGVVDYFLREIPDRAEGTRGLGATIHIAARAGWADIVRRHLEMDPLAVHQRGMLGDTPLHWPCHNGHVEIVEMLLDAGADIEAEEIGCYGGKPLHWASEHAPEVVRLLLERGAEVDSVNAYPASPFRGITPLLFNALQKDDCAEVTRLLLDAGADANRVFQGRKALDIAMAENNHRIADVLRTSKPQQIAGARRIHGLPPLPARPPDAHKGTFGSALIIGGSRGMSGAVALAGVAALHAGAGLVSVAAPGCVAPIVAAAHPSYTTVWLAEEDGQVTPDCVKQVLGVVQRQSAVALGPGMGQSRAVRQVVVQLLAGVHRPMVIDADGLNALVDHLDALDKRPPPHPTVLTPHPGEFARLLRCSVAEVESNRAALAIQFAREHRVVLLLKGARTIVTDGERWYLNTTGGPALATGGSGDVLTGLVAALLAQGMPALDAARLAAHLHGLAGEIMGRQLNDRYATSRDLLDFLSPAWKQLDGGAVDG